MFERYTEKARRVIFFARYEASQYGSASIDSAHILFGLLREDRALMREFVGPTHLEAGIRIEVEKVIKRGKPFATSVEVPFGTESKQILNFAGQEADRLAHQHIGTEHILLGILRLKDSLAARLLASRGARADTIREQIARRSGSVLAVTQPTKGALSTVDDFLATLKGSGCKPLADFFDRRGQFVDSSGKRWVGREEIDKGAETLFAPFAKKNASCLLEDTTAGPSETVVASVLWEFPAVSGDRSKWILRMSIVLASAGEEWAIVLAQVTPLSLGLQVAG
jgi:hypothetical protein